MSEHSGSGKASPRVNSGVVDVAGSTAGAARSHAASSGSSANMESTDSDAAPTPGYPKTRSQSGISKPKSFADGTIRYSGYALQENLTI